MHHDPFWPRASTLIGPRGSVALVDAPLNKSISPGNCDQAPAAIRAGLAYFSNHHYAAGTTVNGLEDLGACNGLLTDLGDRLASRSSEKCVILGGDNGVTYFGVHSLRVPLETIAVITLDAHHDVRHLTDGRHNGNPIRALIEDGLPGPQVWQLGIQSFANSTDYAHYCSTMGIQVVPRDTIPTGGLPAAFAAALSAASQLAEVVYVDLDIDVLDRAFCPGSPGARPGGVTPAELRQVAFLAGQHPKVRAMDIVELDPSRDQNQVTTLTAAACLLEFVAGAR